ncbi:MD1L1 protein, partial [Polypterus senegalus]
MRSVGAGLEVPLFPPTDREPTRPCGPSAELRKQIESSELMNQRLKEIFQKKIQEFRTVCYTLTGYQIDFTTENQYRLISMYAENTDDCLLFKERKMVRKEFSITKALGNHHRSITKIARSETNANGRESTFL